MLCLTSLIQLIGLERHLFCIFPRQIGFHINLFILFSFQPATASCSIVNFLEVESPQENNRGWILLQTLNLLSTGSQALVDRMTAASLPSTLVKCLYLFFDLPSVPCTDVLEDGYEFTPKERRILLQKVFVQVKFSISLYADCSD